MALSNEAIQGLLAFGAGTLANNTGNYGMFGPAVGKGGLLGLQQYGNAQQNSLFSRRQDQDERFRTFQMEDANIARKMKMQEMEAAAASQRRVEELLQGLFGGAPQNSPQNQQGPQVQGASPGPPVQSTPLAPLVTGQNPLQPLATDYVGNALLMGGGPTKKADAILQGAPQQSPVDVPPVEPEGRNWMDPERFVKTGALISGTNPQTGNALISAGTFFQNAIKEEEAAKERDATFARGQKKPLPGLSNVFVDEDSDTFWERVRNKQDQLVWRELSSEEVGAMETALAKSKSNKTIVDMSGNKYSEKLGTGFAEKDLKDFEAAGIAAENVKKLRGVIKHIESSDAITGVGADLLKNIDRAKTLFINSEKSGRRVSDTEMLDAFLGADVFPMISALGLGSKGMDTPAEREFLRQVMTGTISMNKTTLAEMAKLRKNIAERAVAKWNKRVKMLPLNAIEGAGYTRESMMISLDEDPEEERANVRRYNPATGKIE